MTDLPLDSRIEAAQQLLAGLRDRFPSLSPDCQSALCVELERFSENLKQYLNPHLDGVPSSPPLGQVGQVGQQQEQIDARETLASLEKAHADAISERNRLMAVMEALPTGVAIYDIEGRLVQANHLFEELWGSPRQAAYAHSSMLDYKAWWVESGQLVQVGEWASTQAVQTGKPVLNQFLEIERRDGSRRFVLNSGAPILDANRQVIGCAVAMRDISEEIKVKRALRQSEQSLYELEERFRLVLSSLPLTVFMLDRDLRYTWIYNPQYGLTVEQMLGKRDDEVNPRTREEHMATLRSVLETGQGVQREARSDLFGEAKYFLLSYEAFHNESGEVIGILGASLDVTERRRLEEERREAIHQVEMQRQIVENRERERQEIAREIHDGPIQTLVSIMFDLQITRDEIGRPDIQEELDHLSNRLKSAVRELRDVVNNLRPPALLRFGLGKTLKVFLEDFRSKHPELDLELIFDLPDDSIYFPEATTLSLFRLCQEGLNNIARHAQATRATIRFTQREKAVLLEIQDDGQGFLVPRDLLRRTKDGHFGLAGMRERVQALGGEFRLNSSPGAGTVVEVVVPIEQA